MAWGTASWIACFQYRTRKSEKPGSGANALSGLPIDNVPHIVAPVSAAPPGAFPDAAQTPNPRYLSTMSHIL
jgi:hypothetical protein